MVTNPILTLKDGVIRMGHFSLENDRRTILRDVYSRNWGSCISIHNVLFEYHWDILFQELILKTCRRHSLQHFRVNLDLLLLNSLLILITISKWIRQNKSIKYPVSLETCSNKLILNRLTNVGNIQILFVSRIIKYLRTKVQVDLCQFRGLFKHCNIV